MKEAGSFRLLRHCSFRGASGQNEPEDSAVAVELGITPSLSVVKTSIPDVLITFIARSTQGYAWQVALGRVIIQDAYLLSELS